MSSKKTSRRNRTVTCPICKKPHRFEHYPGATLCFECTTDRMEKRSKGTRQFKCLDCDRVYWSDRQEGRPHMDCRGFNVEKL